MDQRQPGMTPGVREPVAAARACVNESLLETDDTR